jgi:hypothetical protein
MPKSEQSLRELDCLRLASDLKQLADVVPGAALKAFLLKLARTCAGLLEREGTMH